MSKAKLIKIIKWLIKNRVILKREFGEYNSISLEYVLNDIWIGGYLKRTSLAWSEKKYEVFLCIIPCFPIHLEWYRGWV